MLTCEYCKKEFSTKGNIMAHQKSAKYCLELQGKNLADDFQCKFCIKKFTTQSNLNDHILVCKKKLKKDNEEKEKMTKDSYDLEIQRLKEEHKKDIEREHKEVIILRDIISKLESRIEQYDKRMYEMASRPSSNTNNSKTVVINNTNLPLTNEVLRQCATTFTIDNARTITGITKHLTSSLEDHIVCTDPSRNIFKYTNEKDEEIVDQDLENLIPQYLTAVKDRNNFLYDEVCKYFSENNIPFDVQTDYAVFYNALNSIIEKKGQQSKYTEKCKQRMVRECRKKFLDRNKNKEKEITKKMKDEEVMMMVIESGGTLNEFIDRIFPNRDIDNEDDELFYYRRKMEDEFISKKREWKKSQCL